MLGLFAGLRLSLIQWFYDIILLLFLHELIILLFVGYLKLSGFLNLISGQAALQLLKLVFIVLVLHGMISLGILTILIFSCSLVFVLLGVHVGLIYLFELFILLFRFLLFVSGIFRIVVLLLLPFFKFVGQLI